MTTKSKKTWFIIADAGRVRTFESNGKKPDFRVRDDVIRTESHKFTRELGSDKPGRGRTSGTGAHYSLQPRADWHDQAEAEFTADICRTLNQACRAKKFDKLYIFAPPKMVGKFRTQLDKQTESRVVKYVARDLTHLADSDVRDRLKDYLSVAGQPPVVNFHRGG